MKYLRQFAHFAAIINLIVIIGFCIQSAIAEYVTGDWRKSPTFTTPTVTGAITGLTNSIEYKTVSAPPGTPANNNSSVSVPCSSGYKVIGGGCDMQQGGMFNQVRVSKPINISPGTNNGWYCQVTVDWDHSDTMRARGYAICIKE